MIENMTTWHPILVHFTVALFATSAALFAAALLLPGRAWSASAQTVAHWNLWIGAALTVATVAAGFYAFYTVDHAEAAHEEMVGHRNWALATAILFWALAAWAARARRRGADVGLAFLAAMAVGVGLLFVTGLEGGELVYEYGVGVESPRGAPAGPTDAGHDHGVERHGEDCEHP